MRPLVVGIAMPSAVVLAVLVLIVGARIRRYLAKAKLPREVELGSMKILSVDASRGGGALMAKSLNTELCRILEELPADQRIGGRFEANVRELVFGAASFSLG